MPVYKTLTIGKNTKILIWKIEESFEELLYKLSLTEKSKQRVDRMKSDLHRRGFLAVRRLLNIAGYSDEEVTYDEFGKPHLNDGKFISITHSFTFCGIIISDKPVGIDIEKQRSKIIKIAHKFTPIEQYEALENQKALISKLTVVWGAKESLYKIYGKKQLHFLEHIYIKDFLPGDKKSVGEIRYKKKVLKHSIFFLEFEGFICVYAF